MHQHFLIYCTANEKRYWQDVLNLDYMRSHHPGVEEVQLLVMVSTARQWSEKDNAFVAYLDSLFKDCPAIKYLGTIAKGNTGRDFSSAKRGLEYLRDHVRADDFVMVRNRSAYGPFTENWYKAYTPDFHSNDRLAIVGNTINLAGSLDKKEYPVRTHVQTYVYVSKWKFLTTLLEDFPGINETEHLEVVRKGEIMLSLRIMERGWDIAALFWPGKLFNSKHPTDTSLPTRDQKGKVRGLPFVHRKAKWTYFHYGIIFRWLVAKKATPSSIISRPSQGE